MNPKPFASGLAQRIVATISAVAALFCLTSAHAVLFRLPLSSDTTTHYYYDHDATSGIKDWKCGTATYNGHRGSDYSGGPRGRAIYAGAVGTLDYKIDGFGDGWIGNTDGGGFGNYVRLAHSGNFKSYYAHMNNGSVTTKSTGSSIACSEQIGGVGTSGNSSGLHLHFEVRLNGVADDPYAGTCGGPISWWVDQGSGSPSTTCEAAVGIPAPPGSLSASAVSSSQINLNWVDNASNETGFKIERATLPGGAWTQIGTVNSNLTSYGSTGLSNSSTYFFRVRAYNASGDSSYSNTASTNTANAAPILTTIANQTINEGQTLALTNTASDPSFGITRVITDFESFASGSANGSVMFRQPSYSGTTSSYLDASPNTSSVTDSFPAGNPSTRVLNVNWSFATGTTDPWLRLTTYAPANLPNPTVSFQQILRFDIRSDKSLKVGLGLRETNTGADIGADGGTSGPIEFVGVTNKTGNTPFPTRAIPANAWTNLQFDLPKEPAVSFTGNGVLESTTGKGVLEHLALVPNAGMGAYNVYLDNFTTTLPHALAYSLDPGAPTGASINATNGVFTWTPTEAQGPGVYSITVRVTDNGSPALSHTRTFSVTVNEVNQAPTLAAISNQTINEETLLSFTASATDPDIPANALTYSLDAGAPAGASINPTSGLFTWTPTEAQGPGVYSITVRVTDNGSPALSHTRTFSVTVNEVNQAPVLTPIADKTVNAGWTLTFTNTATDADLPANALTFSLDAAPAGATIGASSGVFAWTAPAAVAPLTNSATVRVTDNGSPPLSHAMAFNILVVPPPWFSGIAAGSGNVVLTWQTYPGKTYRVEFKNDLNATNWTALGGDIVAAGSSLSITNPAAAPQRYYRVAQVD